MTLTAKRGSGWDTFAIGYTGKGVALCGQKSWEKEDKLDDGHHVIIE
jgi:hypothetical protein